MVLDCYRGRRELDGEDFKSMVRRHSLQRGTWISVLEARLIIVFFCSAWLRKAAVFIV